MFAGPTAGRPTDRSYRTDYSFVALIFMSIMATDICLIGGVLFSSHQRKGAKGEGHESGISFMAQTPQRSGSGSGSGSGSDRLCSGLSNCRRLVKCTI